MSNGGFAMFKGPPTEEEFRLLLAESGIEKTFEAVETYFPEDAAQWRQDLSHMIDQRRKGLYTTTNGLDVGTALRRKHAAHLATASDPLLVGVMQQQLRLHRLFEDDPDACNRFLMEGGYGLERAEIQSLKPVLNDGAILFEAMHDGLTSPVSRDPSTEDDWLALFELMIDKGATNDDIQLVSEPDATNPALCGAFISFMDALATADFDGAERIRAEMAVAFISA